MKLIRRKNRHTVAFREAILATFGKLDHKDILAIDGDAEQLLMHLMKRYRWSLDETRRRVAKFHADLLIRSQSESFAVNAGVEA